MRLNSGASPAIRWLLGNWLRLCALGLVPCSAFSQIQIQPGLRVDYPSASMVALRDSNLVRQRFDFSCGAAALATILRYGFGEDIGEEQILLALFAVLSEEEREQARATGFSLLDLQRVAASLGYRAAGFRLQSHQLSLLGGPVIVFFEPRGYAHFAVLRGVIGDRAYLADPSRGNIRQPMYRFLEGWEQEDGTGIIFVVEPENGSPDAPMPLALTSEAGTLPEILSIRELMTNGDPLRRGMELSN